MPEQITVYRFEELSEEAQDRVIEAHRYDEAIGPDAEEIEEQMLSILGGIGLDADELSVHFRLAFAQGDGVAVSGTLALEALPDPEDPFPWAEEKGIIAPRFEEIKRMAPNLVAFQEENGLSLVAQVPAPKGNYPNQQDVELELYDHDVIMSDLFDEAEGDDEYDRLKDLEAKITDETREVESFLTRYLDKVGDVLMHSAHDDLLEATKDDYIREWLEANDLGRYTVLGDPV